MLIFLGAGALLRNEFLLGAFLLGGIAGWYLAETGSSTADTSRRTVTP